MKARHPSTAKQLSREDCAHAHHDENWQACCRSPSFINMQHALSVGASKCSTLRFMLHSFNKSCKLKAPWHFFVGFELLFQLSRCCVGSFFIPLLQLFRPQPINF